MANTRTNKTTALEAAAFLDWLAAMPKAPTRNGDDAMWETASNIVGDVLEYCDDAMAEAIEEVREEASDEANEMEGDFWRSVAAKLR